MLETVRKKLHTLFNCFSIVERLEADNKALTKQLAEAHKGARIDALTSAQNGLALGERLETLIQKIHKDQENGIYSAFFMLDLDRFKGVNDHPDLGHGAGDECLQKFTKHLQDFVRQDTNDRRHNSESNRLADELYTHDNDDSAFRQGGDEFALIFRFKASSHEEAKEKLKAITARLKQRLAVQSFEYNGFTVPIVSSIGAHLMQPGETVDSIKKAADHKLYADKSFKSTRWAQAITQLKAQGITNLKVPAEGRGVYQFGDMKITSHTGIKTVMAHEEAFDFSTAANRYTNPSPQEDHGFYL